jgi:hypothetical protein
LNEVCVSNHHKSEVLRICEWVAAAQVVTAFCDHEQQWIHKLGVHGRRGAAQSSGHWIAISPTGLTSSFFQREPTNGGIQREDLLRQDFESPFCPLADLKRSFVPDFMDFALLPRSRRPRHNRSRLALQR